MNLDLNSDLGEGESLARTRSLMRNITSANVACGGHAGDLITIKRCVELAGEFHVHLGAHPGPWNRGDFGRSAIHISPPELELLLLHQVGALERIANASGLRLHHIKLHGALYHAVEADRALAVSYVKAVERWWPTMKIYARAAGAVVELARRARVEVWPEAFADRNYSDDGLLIPRTAPNALLTSVSQIEERMRRLAEANEILSVSGKRLRVDAKTICVHSDTPNAVTIARALRKVLG